MTESSETQDERAEPAAPDVPLDPTEEGNYEDVSGGETSPQSGAPEEAAEQGSEDAGDA